jgi:hypothetical protein
MGNWLRSLCCISAEWRCPVVATSVDRVVSKCTVVWVLVVDKVSDVGGPDVGGFELSD